MFITSEGIILRQTKISGGRRMILLFTKKYGKISAGSNINEKGKSKSSLAMRPFTYGNYELYKKGDFYNINTADVKQSYYRIGEDVDKYMGASYILELTEKVLPEGLPQPRIFNLIIDFMSEMENRQSKQLTLILAYEVKLISALGMFPQMEECALCGCKESLNYFSVEEGGMICEKCRSNALNFEHVSLIYDGKFGIVDILKYFASNPLHTFRKIGLNDSVAEQLQVILKSYMSRHLDIGNLKSESFFNGRF